MCSVCNKKCSSAANLQEHRKVSKMKANSQQALTSLRCETVVLRSLESRCNGNLCVISLMVTEPMYFIAGIYFCNHNQLNQNLPKVLMYLLPKPKTFVLGSFMHSIIKSKMPAVLKHS